MKHRVRFLNLTIILAIILSLSIVFEPLHPTMAQEPVGEEPGKSPETEQTLPLEVTAPEAVTRAFSGGPEYDSEWVSLGQDEAKTLTHNLGGSVDNYVVDMQYRARGVDGINLRYYGGADFGIHPAPGHAEDDRVGAYWRSLNATDITVYRRPEDTYAEQVRIRIWIDPVPNFDSGWFGIPANGVNTLAHNLGGNVNDYVVDMQYRSVGSGVNQRYYGGADFGDTNTVGSPDDRVGAYWRSLTTTNITVFRRAEDTYAPEVRIRIWVRPRATYDSGWVNINQDQAITLNHNIGGDVKDYLVDMEYLTPDVNGVNTRYFGGADFGASPAPGHLVDDRVGAYWRSLNEASITIYRRPEDDYAPQVRIRIFRFWDIPAPDYNSGWVDIAPDSTVTLNHDLGGDVNTYLVDTEYRSQSVDGVNLRYYGGSDFGDTVTVGSPNDRVGAYWRSLTASSIIVYRRPEDTYAEQVRIRIWRTPKPDYDSGWIAKSPGEAASVLNHNLGGNYQGDYFVDFEYRNAGDGINQRYYGGADFGALAFGGGSENTRAGAYWRSLNNQSVSIYRRPDDIYAAELRLRIWRIAIPDYDSAWIALSQDEAQTLAHNLGDSTDGYLVQMYQWDTDINNTLNQRHFGGADFGNLPPAGYAENDRVGAYWRSLTSDNVTVYRRPDDGFSDFVRLRIWNFTQKIYIPITLNN
jgi:hypothetical protein